MIRRTVKYYPSRVKAEAQKYGRAYVEKKYGKTVYAKVVGKKTKIKFAKKKAPHGHTHTQNGSPTRAKPTAKSRGYASLAKRAGDSLKNAAPKAKGLWEAGKSMAFAEGGMRDPVMTKEQFKRQMNFNLDNDEDLAQGSQRATAQPTSISHLISGQLRQASNNTVDAWEQWAQTKNGQTDITRRGGSPFGIEAQFQQANDADTQQQEGRIGLNIDADGVVRYNATSPATKLAQRNPMGAFGTPNVMYDLGEEPQDSEFDSHESEETIMGPRPPISETQWWDIRHSTPVAQRDGATTYAAYVKENEANNIRIYGSNSTTPKPTGGTTPASGASTFGGFTEYGVNFTNSKDQQAWQKADATGYATNLKSRQAIDAKAAADIKRLPPPPGGLNGQWDPNSTHSKASDAIWKKADQDKKALLQSGYADFYNTQNPGGKPMSYNPTAGTIEYGEAPKAPGAPTGPGTQGNGYQQSPLPTLNTGARPEPVFKPTSAVYNPWGYGEGAANNMMGPSSAQMGNATMEAMSLANAYFAPQRAELAYELGDMETDMRRLAVNLGRQVDDPVLQAKLYKEASRAVRTLDIQQNTYAFQMADSRRKEENQNWQFYDQMAQEEDRLRMANEQFYQGLDLQKSGYNLQNWIAMQNAGSPLPGSSAPPASAQQSRYSGPAQSVTPASSQMGGIYSRTRY